MKKSEQVNEIAKALAAAQREMRPAIKDSANPFFKSKFADLNSIWEAIREPIMSKEIAIIQDAITTEAGVEIYTSLIHSSGQWLEFGPFCVPLVKKDPQSVGSATSYGKRYALCAAAGVVSGDDDDAETAQQAYRQKQNAKENVSHLKNLEEEKIAYLSKEQKEELSKLVELLNTNQITNFWDYMKENLGAACWEEVESKHFKNLKSKLTISVEHAKKLVEEKVKSN